MGRGFLRPWVCVLVLQVLAGCAGSPIDLSSRETIPQTEGVAFGRVRLTSDGQAQTLSSFLGESKLSVFVLADDDQAPIRHRLKDDGYFFWRLPPGGYTITSFQGLTPEFFSKHMKGRIFASFNILGDTATYIGTLDITMRGYSYKLFVENEYPLAVAEFARRFPNVGQEIRTSLMTLESRR